MNSKSLTKTSAIILGTAMGLGLAGQAAADANPFGLTDLGHGYMVAAEGTCGEKKAEPQEGKCGENKPAPKAEAEGKCAANNETPVPQPKNEEGKCGAKG